ncbi:MAG: TIGR01212 family radical SAM protein [Deferribacterales bacterium]
MKNNAATGFYNSLNSYLKNQYNAKVRKVSIDAGFTCPNRDGNKGVGGCIYCNVDSFTQKAENGIREQAISQISKLRSKGIEKFIIYFQSYSNTYSDLETIRKRVEAALIDDGIVAVYIGTRPDVIDEEKLAYFAELNKKYDVMLEYGLQSANDSTLKIINRGHTKDEFVNAVRMTHRFGIKTCAHIIFGLPGDTREDMLNSVKLCSELGVHSVKFHHLHIVKGTQMSEMYLAGKIMLLSEMDYTSVLAEAITYLAPDMVVARIVGDAAGDTLIAPMWPENKSAFSAGLEAYMSEHGLYQGKNFK